MTVVTMSYHSFTLYNGYFLAATVIGLSLFAGNGFGEFYEFAVLYTAMSFVLAAGVAGGIMYLHEQLLRTGTILLGG